MLLGLESFSYYLAFSAGKMDIFGFIRKAKALGLDGVQINMEGDHLVIKIDDTPMIVGVPLGTGAIDLNSCYRILAEKTDLDRINIEVCYGYAAPFRVDATQGEGAVLGEGAFAVTPPPFDPEVVAPHLVDPKAKGFKSYAWQELAGLVDDNEMKRLIAWQEKAVETSVAYARRLRRQWSSR